MDSYRRNTICEDARLEKIVFQKHDRNNCIDRFSELIWNNAQKTITCLANNVKVKHFQNQNFIAIKNYNTVVQMKQLPLKEVQDGVKSTIDCDESPAHAVENEDDCTRGRKLSET